MSVKIVWTRSWISSSAIFCKSYMNEQRGPCFSNRQGQHDWLKIRVAYSSGCKKIVQPLKLNPACGPSSALERLWKSVVKWSAPP